MMKAARLIGNDAEWEYWNNYRAGSGSDAGDPEKIRALHFDEEYARFRAEAIQAIEDCMEDPTNDRFDNEGDVHWCHECEKEDCPFHSINLSAYVFSFNSNCRQGRIWMTCDNDEECYFVADRVVCSVNKVRNNYEKYITHDPSEGNNSSVSNDKSVYMTTRKGSLTRHLEQCDKYKESRSEFFGQ